VIEAVWFALRQQVRPGERGRLVEGFAGWAWELGVREKTLVSALVWASVSFAQLVSFRQESI